MKKRNRFAAAALAALLLAGSAPSALALDATPPMYQQFGYDSAEDFTRSYLGNFVHFDYDTASDMFRRYVQQLHADPSLGFSYFGLEDMDTLYRYIDYGQWKDMDDYCRQAAREMIQTADYRSEQLAVQLNGQAVKFPDAQPEKANNRTMVPFRAIAEALGAEVDYNAGAITAKKNGQTLAFSLGGKQLTITDDSTGKVIKTTAVDSAPYKKKGRTYVPVRFFAEGFGLTVQWENSVQTAVLYDRDALIADIDSHFTVLNQWLKAQPSYGQNAKALSSTINVSTDYTLYDSIAGDKSYRASAKINALTDENAAEVHLSADLSDLPSEYYPNYSSIPFVTDDSFEWSIFRTLRSSDKSTLKNLQVDLCGSDSGAGCFYMRSPALSEMYRGTEKDRPEERTAMKNGAWVNVATMDTVFGATDFAERWSELAQGKVNTVGESIVINSEKNTYGYEWSKLFADAYEECRNWEALAGDGLFTRSGSRYTANIDLQDMLGSDPDTSTSTIKYTLDTSNGSISGSTSSSYTNWYTQSITTIEFSGKLRSLSFMRTEQVKNKSKLVRRSTLTASPTDTAPAATPPKGSKIILWDTESTYYDEDGNEITDMSDFLSTFL